MKRLTDQQLSEAEAKANLSGVPLSVCPACGSRPDEDGDRDFNGCDCQGQIALRRAYLTANIPSAYHYLDWKRDFEGPSHIKTDILEYIFYWPELRKSGIGLELGGEILGTGKTFGAITIGKQLIKDGEDVYFCEFADLLSNEFDGSERITDSHVLVLDEVKKPYSDKQRDFFGSKFEDLIRRRSNWLGVTIITTNLSEDEINFFYPRAFSLLRAKQIRIDFSGEDYRISLGEGMLIKNALNNEPRSIT